MRVCANWLKAWDQMIESKNSDDLLSMVQNPKVPYNITRRLHIPSIDISIHEQKNVLAKFGSWIQRFKQEISDNRVDPCFVCHMLQSKKTVWQL